MLCTGKESRTEHRCIVLSFSVCAAMFLTVCTGQKAMFYRNVPNLAAVLASFVRRLSAGINPAENAHIALLLVADIMWDGSLLMSCARPLDWLMMMMMRTTVSVTSALHSHRCMFVVLQWGACTWYLVDGMYCLWT